MHSYDDLCARWKRLRGAGDFAIREIACSGVPRTLLCVESTAPGSAAITISAGIHGDEPAGVYALLDLAERGELAPNLAYRIWPCMNPSGFEAGTRKSSDGIDVNRTFARGGTAPESRAIITATRDRRFALSIDLHEDDTTRAFYCYEYGPQGVAAAANAAVRDAGFALEDDPLLRPDPELEQAAIGGLSYTLWLARRAAERAVTFESPARLPLAQRVEIHRIAVKAALAAL